MSKSLLPQLVEEHTLHLRLDAPVVLFLPGGETLGWGGRGVGAAGGVVLEVARGERGREFRILLDHLNI